MSDSASVQSHYSFNPETKQKLYHLFMAAIFITLLIAIFPLLFSTTGGVDLSRNVTLFPSTNNEGNFEKNNICRSTLARSTLEDVANITGFEPLCERDFFVRLGFNHKGILICKYNGQNELNLREFIPNHEGIWKATRKGIRLTLQEWVSLKEQLAAIDCGLSLLDDAC